MQFSIINRRCVFTFVFLLTIAAGVYAQTETKRNDRPFTDGDPSKRSVGKPEADTTRYGWEFAQPNFTISHIVIEHDGRGRGHVTFERKNAEEAISETFELSPAALGRVQNLWAALRFLDSNENYQSSRNFAHLGTYKLRLEEGKRQRTAEFNWSHNSNAWDLAQEYRRVADQAILIFDITVARENQPLNTPGLLNQLESMYNRNSLSDAKQLVPLLRELRTDEHIPLIARNHAERLLKKIDK